MKGIDDDIDSIAGDYYFLDIIYEITNVATSNFITIEDLQILFETGLCIDEFNIKHD